MKATRQARRLGTGFFVSAASTLVIYGLVMLLSRFREPTGFALYGLLWLLGVQALLWWLFVRIDRATAVRWCEPERAGRRTLAFAVACVASGIAIFNLSYCILRLYEIRGLGINTTFGWQQLAAASGIGAILAGVLAATVLARGHLERWRGAVIATRALEQEQTKLRLAALRRQLDPHFLFNSLSTLAAIIPENPVRATRYVEELAALYRHVLRDGDREVVPLDEELASAEALGFVLGHRFEDAFRLIVTHASRKPTAAVVPMTVMTLIENAVKHNEVTPRHPLAVTIAVRSTPEGDTLIVDHAHRPKPARHHDGIGLATLERSYSLLTDRPFTVEQSDGRFTVRVPVLDVESYAHADHRG